jgi:hypothetical protein
LPDATVPPELEPTVKQLRATLAYKGFRVVETLIARSRDGQELQTSSAFKWTSDATLQTMFEFRCTPTVLSEASGRMVRIDKMRSSVRAPVSWGTGESKVNHTIVDSGISADLDVKEGQKVVVGKTGIGGSDRAVVFVLTAKVVD